MAEDFKCNVLIMGKTGTGKSTLLNYLCDSRIAETGSGKPVTGEGIYEYPVTINGQEVRVFDSWGIEAGKVERWKILIDQSLKEHGVQKRMEDWFHSVIYCIQAGGGRIEEIDTEIIRRFLVDGYLLTVVLTKADQVDEQDEQQMRKVLLNELKSYIPSSGRGKINIISTCAEKKKTRAGETIPFGKEEVQKAILEGWKETVLERLPKHVVARLCEIVDEWKEKEISVLSQKDVSGIPENNQRIYQEIYEDANALTESLKKDSKLILDEAVESCKKADTSLKVMLDISLEETPAKQDTPMKWWEWIFAISLTVFAGIPIFIKSIIDDLSPKKKGEEKQHIKDYIVGIAEEIKSNCQKFEPQIARELKKAL